MEQKYNKCDKCDLMRASLYVEDGQKSLIFQDKEKPYAHIEKLTPEILIKNFA